MNKLLDFRDNRSWTIFITDRAGNTTGIYVDINGISTAIEYTIIAYSQNRGPNNYALTWRLYIYQTNNTYYDRLPITLGSGGTGAFTYNLANASWKLVFEWSAHLRLWHFDIPITGGQTVVDFSTGDTLTGNFQTNPQELLISNGVVFLRAGDVIKGAWETNGRNYINAPDLDAMLEQSTLWFAGDPHFDINKDGSVNSSDTTILINNYFVEWFGYARGLTY
jgi:hypothetical protein